MYYIKYYIHAHTYMYIYSLLIPSKQGGEKLSAEGTQPSDGNVALNTSLQWAALNIQQGV